MPANTQAAPLNWDGFSILAKGMNDGEAAQLLDPTQAALLINATVRGDFAEQRPGWRRVMTVLKSPVFGRFQHMGSYRTDANQLLFPVVVGGRFFRVNPFQKTVVEFTIPSDANPSTLERGWSVQGELFWIYNDGQTLPLIWTGGNARRARKNEIQPGTVIAYVQGRLWYALPDGVSFRAGDLVRNTDSGSAIYGYRDSILHETENTFLNEGGDFSVPADCGEITAMSAALQLDMSQGQGPLQVLCQRNGFSVNTPVDRTVWKSVNYPIQTESLIGAGCSSQQGLALVNGDLWFRAPDGLRSWMIARRQFRDFGNTPQSFEMSGFFDADQAGLLAFGSSVVADNRFITTLSPSWSDLGVYHRGLGVVDLSPIASMQGSAPPVYDGLWTGLNILAIRQVDEGVFAMVLEDDGTMALWQLTTNEIYDDSDGRVQWTVVPRSMFVERDASGRPIRQFKRLETADLEYDQLQGEVDFRVSWQPDAYPCPTVWSSWKECVPNCFASLDCTKPLVYQSGYQPRKRLPEPPDACAQGSTRPLRNFYTVNPRIDITGPARILSARFGASLQPEPKYEANACEVVPCLPIQCCGYDPFTYRAKGTSGEYGSGYSGSGSGYPVPPPQPPPEPPQPPVTPPYVPVGLAGGPNGEPPPPAIEVPGGPFDIPVVNGWQSPMSGAYISLFAITKISDNPGADGLTQAVLNFWEQSLIAQWNNDPFHPTGWSQAVFAFTWVDPYFGWWGDLNAKYATGDPVPHEGDQQFQPGPMWELAILWR